MMTPPPAQHLRRAAFTLLEVMIAVFIVMLLAVSLFRFLQVNLDAIATTTDSMLEEEKYGALFRYLQGQLSDIPPRGQGLLLGKASRFRDLDADEMQWVCRAGPGLLTTAAGGEYKTTLLLRPQSETSRIYDLGLRRSPSDGKDKDPHFIPLIRDVAAVRIRYWHPQLNAAVDNWNDQNTRPSFVKITIWKNKDAPLTEAVLPIPAAQVQQ
jgi:hypothetical protein